MIYKIVAVIWFLGAVIWPFTATLNFRMGNYGLAALNVALMILFAAAGVSYWVIS